MSTRALGPYIAIYCREILGDVDIASLKDEQFGRLVKYWAVLSEMGGKLPGDPVEIGKRCRVNVRKVKGDFAWFPTFFTFCLVDGCWHSERLERQAEKYKKKLDVAREVGKKGNPHLGGVPLPESDPYMGVDGTPDMGVANTPQSGVIAGVFQSQAHSNTPVVPLGDDAHQGGEDGFRATAGDLALDRYVRAIAKLMAQRWPTQSTTGPMPHASESAVYARLVTLHKEGHHIDQLRGRANAYLAECAPGGCAVAKIGTKAPQSFFGRKGPWRDYEDTPTLAPLPESFIVKTLNNQPS